MQYYSGPLEKRLLNVNWSVAFYSTVVPAVSSGKKNLESKIVLPYRTCGSLQQDCVIFSNTELLMELIKHHKKLYFWDNIHNIAL